MALPGSGTITLNQMHVEVGGSSGSACSLNDSDIRGLIGKGSGVSMSFSEWYGASAFTPDTQLQITSANTGIKFATPSFSTYSAGVTAGSHGSAADKRIILDQGQQCHIQQSSSSQFMQNAFSLDFTSGAGSTSGMSRTDYMTGHYWRTGNIGGAGNPGNHLMGASQALDLTGMGLSFTGQRFNSSNFGTGNPLGTSAGTQVTIQVY